MPIDLTQDILSIGNYEDYDPSIYIDDAFKKADANFGRIFDAITQISAALNLSAGSWALFAGGGHIYRIGSDTDGVFKLQQALTALGFNGTESDDEGATGDYITIMPWEFGAPMSMEIKQPVPIVAEIKEPIPIVSEISDKYPEGKGILSKIKKHMKKVFFIAIIVLAGITACAQQSVDILMRKSLPKITLTGLNGTAAQINLNGYTITTSSGLITIAGASLNLGTNSLLGSGSIGTNLNRFANGYYTNIDFTNYPTVQGVPIFYNPPITGTLSVPGNPVNANDAVNKSYVDSRIALGLFWVAPCEDIVSTLANSITIGKRYILSTNNHIYTSNGDNTWTDGGVTATGTTAYVKTDANIPANSVGPYNYNGSAWVSIGISGNHNDLTSIQGGTANQYYHLTSAEYTFFQSLPPPGTANNLQISNGTNWTSTAVPTWNQSTTGTAAKATILATARSIYGNNFDGSGPLLGVIGSVYGGTANAFTKFSGPATAEKTFTLPNVSANILTDNTAVTVGQGGTGVNTLNPTYALLASGTSFINPVQALPNGTAGQLLVSRGANNLPVWQTAIPGGNVTVDSAQTLTNKTLTLPKINENVQLTATATEINPLHNGAILNNTSLLGLTDINSLRIGGTNSAVLNSITYDSAGVIIKVNGSPIQTYIPPENRQSVSTYKYIAHVIPSSGDTSNYPVPGMPGMVYIDSTGSNSYLSTGSARNKWMKLANGKYVDATSSIQGQLDAATARITALENANSQPIYYVANAGSDAANGLTISTPWQTIAKVNASTFSPGTRINFKKGDTWRETLIIPSSGTSANYITFGAYGIGNAPKILGSSLVTAWTNRSGNVWKSIANFTNPALIPDYGNIYFKETSGSITWGRVEKATTWRNCVTEYDWYWHGDTIYIYSPTNPNNRYSGVEVSQRQTCVNLDSKTYLTFDGIEIAYAGEFGIISLPYNSLTNISGLIVKNCDIHHFGSKRGFGGLALSLWYSDMLIQNNTIHDASRRNISLNLDANVIQAHDIIIENNTMYDAYHTSGVDINTTDAGTWDNIIIRKNLIYQNTLAVDTAENPVVNLMFLAVQGTFTGSVTNVYVYNNIFKNNNLSAITIEHVNSVFIYNNTFYGFSTGISDQGLTMINVSGVGTSIIKNNIFYDNMPSTTSPYTRCFNIISGPTVTMDYNLYYVPDASQIIGCWHTTYYPLSAWATYKSTSSQDANSPTPANPLFTSTTDLSLQAGSPAINAGVVITGMPQSDFLGNPIVGLRDIGAYEKQ
jgi:hypothetical protein